MATKMYTNKEKQSYACIYLIYISIFTESSWLDIFCSCTYRFSEEVILIMNIFLIWENNVMSFVFWQPETNFSF